MKKSLFLILGFILFFGVFSLFSQLSIVEEPTNTPTSEVIVETTNPPITEPTIELTNEPMVESGFELSSDVPDSRDAKEIIKTLEQAYTVEADAAYTFDFSKFPSVFVNDPRFPVSPGTLETVRQLTLNPALESAGWLDYKMAYYSWVRDSILLSEAVHAKAKAENRELTENEKKLLKDPWGRTAPARAEGPTRKNIINYLTLEINDDIANVTLIRGAYFSEVTLVLIHKKWYVANERFLSVSP
jgi:hypothetical protein